MSAQAGDRKKKEREAQEAGLDKALEQTFPASDPFSIGRFTANEPPSRPPDRMAPRLDRQGTKGRGAPSGQGRGGRSVARRPRAQRSMDIFCLRA